jgi:peroxiredoxin
MRRPIVVLLSLLVTACGSTAEAPPEVPVGVEVGHRPPPLRGVLSDGGEFSLDGRSAQVLVFYRSAQCGLCRVQLQALQNHLSAYQRQGVQVVAVTLDPPALGQQLRESMELEFDLVSVDTATFEAWRVMGGGMRLPVPATYLIDRNGVIQYKHVGRNASDRATDADVLTVLGRLDAR